MKRHLLAALLAALVPLGLSADAAYRLVAEIHVGGEGGWDYLTMDPGAHRLYVSHATHVVVIDTQRDAVVGDIPDTPGVHGFALAPDLHRGFSTNGREATASIIDLDTLKLVSKVSTGENPDAVLYDASRHEVYTFNGRGQSATVFDGKTGAVVATVPLGGKPETGVVDPAAGRVYVNIEDKNEIAVIETKTHTVVARWPIAPGEEASGLAIDLAHHRLFAGCHNELMVMVDSETGKVVATVPIGQGVDGTAFDPATGLAFSSNGEGTVTIAQEETPGTLKVVQTLKTRRSARTIALDPATHRIYLSAATLEPLPAGQQGRPRMKPDSFAVLVYGR